MVQEVSVVDSWRELQKNSYISWVAKYESEKKKRIEAEEKYEALVERIKATALEEYYTKLLSEEDQHKMKAPILEWDGDRMDIIGQNGNTGDHYQYELFEDDDDDTKH